MTFEELRDKAHALPLKPGVYIMQNGASEVIYVGKIGRASCRDRV